MGGWVGCWVGGLRGLGAVWRYGSMIACGPLGIVYVCLIFGLLWACLIRLVRTVESLQWLMGVEWCR